MSSIEIILEDLKSHPSCAHGPTILFSRPSEVKPHRFFACAACRDRKDCSFYLSHDGSKVSAIKTKRWEEEKKKFVLGVNHRKAFLNLNKIKQLTPVLRRYCHTCNDFVPEQFRAKHDTHNVVENVTDYMLTHPSEFLTPLENTKIEAQFLFSKLTVTTIVDIIREKGFRNIICLGVPRIHEYISEECADLNTILLDIDRRYHTFIGPLQFCWYNMFNDHFFLPDAKSVFHDFLQNDRGEGVVLLTDPPFGGRVELLTQTFKSIEFLYKALNGRDDDLPIFWFFPYFMEPQILNSRPDYSMLDYKVDYDNHPLFREGPKGRKLGSPVRIFTNIDPSTIKLPSDQGYKFCKVCKRWVSLENKHCKECGVCTSKDGRRYVHCKRCERCVKPTWIHCDTCRRCAQPDHTCQELKFSLSCFHCKEPGHKKRDCPKVDHEELQRKRKKGIKSKSLKLKKV